MISTGYGTGSHDVVLHWADGVKTRILSNLEDMNRNPPLATVDGEAAQGYRRDTSFYSIVDNPDSRDETMFCNRILANQNSVCYKFTDK